MSTNRAIAARVLVAVLIAVGALAAAAAAEDRRDYSLAAIDGEAWTRADAAHLLRRAGFGATPDEIDRTHAMGLDAAVDRLLDFERPAYRPRGPAMDPLITEPIDYQALRQLGEQERRERVQAYQRAQRESFRTIRQWWIERLLHSPHPAQERLTLFWHNHFTSGMRKVRNAVYMYEQNELLRRHAAGSFETLVRAISRDRAMLSYLDGNRNVARQPNENYARELLELFTLGVGNYTEDDIKAAARAFTGWSFNANGFVFNERQHDYGPKAFLGERGQLTGDDIITIILDENECSEFLGRKLLTAFCRPDPDERLVRSLARTIRRHDYELRPVLAELWRSEAFYHPAARASLIKSPVDIVVGTARQLGLDVHNAAAAEFAMVAMGQALLEPPNVKGWDGGEKWITAATLYARYSTTSRLIEGFPASRIAPGERQPAYDPLPLLRSRELSEPAEIVAFYCEYLLAEPLPAGKQDLLMEYLDGPRRDFDIHAADAAERVRTMLMLLTSTPEYQLY